MVLQPGAGHLQGQALVVGIGDQGDALAQLAHAGEEGFHMGMDGDQVGDFFLQPHDVQFGFRGPKIHRIPLQGADAGVEAGGQFLAAGRQAHAPRLGMAQGHVLLPEVVVEMEIEQGAVHVQQDGVHAVPVDHGRGAGAVSGQTVASPGPPAPRADARAWRGRRLPDRGP